MIIYQNSSPSSRMVAQSHEYSCGAACVLQLLFDAGIEDVTEDDICAAAEFDPESGIFAPLLARAWENASNGRFQCRGGVPDIDPVELSSLLKCPAIFMLEKHWVIVDNIANGVVWVRDPNPLPGDCCGIEGTLLFSDFFGYWCAGRYQAVWRTK